LWIFLLCDRQKTGRPRNEPDAVKTVYIEMRVEQSEKDTFRAAADAAGLPLSGWIRQRLRRDAKKELEDLGLPVAFLERLSA
jgi:uncharacterized protein (DUF1778 family)